MLIRLVLSAFMLAGLASCATDVKLEPGDARPQPSIAIRKLSLDPTNGGQTVPVAALRTGDILLSAMDGVNSAGIRLFTLAPVSHAAIYVGDAQIVEAVGEGVRLRSAEAMLADESVVVAFRHPAIEDHHGERIREFSMQQVGGKYNHVGLLLNASFSLERRLCDLPLLPQAVRDFCVRGIASIQLGAQDNDRFFCSQLVLEAYRQAGLPITDAQPQLVSPADLLHMREGDVPTVRSREPLLYVGHLKFKPASATAERVDVAAR